MAESAFAGDLGMQIDLARGPRGGIERDDLLLYSESAGRFVVTVLPEKVEVFEKLFAGLPLARVGEVTAERVLKLKGLSGDLIVEEGIDRLKESWQAPLRF